MKSKETPTKLSSPIEQYLKSLHLKHASCMEGHVADYIPELAKSKPEWFSICIATRDGQVYEVGDSRQAFTIQSISKALAYGLALEDRGEDYILERISVEPSGDAFNAISLKPDNGAPFNPMINAGAIATDGQVLPKEGLSRIDRILAYLSACAGRKLDIDPIVYQSESETGHRNRAIGWMLRNFDIIEEEPTDILETYFQQCAIRVTCRDLAVMAATLANHGRNPLTREQAILPEYVDNILSVMASCGMYDYSGEWIYQVGLPAKSGVGGGIMAVLPGQLGIGIFSPPLDKQGNSVRGIRVCRDLSRDLSLHMFANSAKPNTSLRGFYDASQISSRHRRTPRQMQALMGSGHRIRIFDLQGALIFSSVEPIIRIALKQAPFCDFVLLNFKNVLDVNEIVVKILLELQINLQQSDVSLVVCHADHCLKRYKKEFAHYFSDDDAALEYCENNLLSHLIGEHWGTEEMITIADAPIFSSLEKSDLDWLDAQMPHHTGSVGEGIISTGDLANRLYILLSGSVEVMLPASPNGQAKRLDVFSAGMCFGEMGFIDGASRSADVVVVKPITYRTIDKLLFDRLDQERPQVKIQLLEFLARQISYNLRKSNDEAMAYKGGNHL